MSDRLSRRSTIARLLREALSLNEADDDGDDAMEVYAALAAEDRAEIDRMIGVRATLH